MTALAAPGSSRSKSTRALRAYACRRSVESSPNAENVDALLGTTIRRSPRSGSIAAAWVGPAPPYAISTNSRGSSPRSTVSTRMAFTMWARASSSMPDAAWTRSIPSGCATRSRTARSAAARSSARLPSRKWAGSM